MVTCIRFSCRSLSFRFQWAGALSGEPPQVRDGWQALLSAMNLPSSVTGWSPVVTDGPRRLLHALVVDGKAGERCADLREVVGGLRCVGLLFLEEPEGGVAWRAVLPLSTPIDLSDADDLAAWQDACALAAAVLAREVGVSNPDDVLQIHAVPPASFGTRHAAMVQVKGYPVNVQGMRASRAPGEAFSFERALRLGDVRWHLGVGEQHRLAAALWTVVGAGRHWPHPGAVGGALPLSATETAMVTGLDASLAPNGSVDLVLGPLSWRLSPDEAAELAIALW